MKAEPRNLPVGTGFTVPHVNCFRAAKQFLTQLRAAEADLVAREQDPAMQALARFSGGMQYLSEAVQIFAGMTAEAALNLYGVLALGEEKFYKEIDRKHFPEKLKAIMALGREAPVAPDAELLAIAARLSSARNAFVHPKPRELRSDGSHVESAGNPDLASAERSIIDVERFIFLLRTRDREYYTYLGLI